MRTLPGYLEFPESVGAVGVIVRPETAYRLLGVPQHEIANRTLDADEVLGRAVRPWAHLALTRINIEPTSPRYRRASGLRSNHVCVGISARRQTRHERGDPRSAC